jgi:hypothetical protein
MNHAFPRGLSRPLVILTFFAAITALLALAPGLTAEAAAADRGTIFKTGGDVTLASGDTAKAIIVIGGDASVAGTVTDTIAVVGGDVRLQPTAVVGSANSTGDTAVILVGGTLTRAPGATVQGKISDVSAGWAGDLGTAGLAGVVRSPFSGWGLLGWLGGTILSLLGAVLIVALLPRQVNATRDRARARFWPSLGWGALSLLVIVPLVTVLLVITIIGLLAILPWLFVVVATLVMGAVGVSVLLGQVILPRLGYHGTSLILAAVIGVVVLRLVALIPIVGSIVIALAWIVGFGAAILAVRSWQRHRHDRNIPSLRPAEENERRAA